MPHVASEKNAPKRNSGANLEAVSVENTYSRRLKAVAAVLMLAAMTACSMLPAVGPSKKQILEGSVQRNGDAFVVDVNDHVTRAAGVQQVLAFDPAFQRAGVVGSDTINPGDTLGLTIYENVDDGLLTSTGSNSATLEEVQVDGAGFIFVPYAGRIRAAGNSPEAIRRVITNKLQDQTPDPQVQVRRLAGDGASVTLLGKVGGQGVYPIERPTRKLTGMLAKAGGVTIEPDVAEITIMRGNYRGKVWLEDLYRNPRNDVALRGGDRILVEADNRSFTALGATGTQTQVTFEERTITGIEALAQVGGLAAMGADPTGIFVFRDEPEYIARKVLNRNDLQGSQRLIYVLNLTRPNGMFMARDFVIRDGDTVYVTEAPYTQFAKVLTALTSTAGTANSLVNATTVGN